VALQSNASHQKAHTPANETTDPGIFFCPDLMSYLISLSAARPNRIYEGSEALRKEIFVVLSKIAVICATSWGLPNLDKRRLSGQVISLTILCKTEKTITVKPGSCTACDHDRALKAAYEQGFSTSFGYLAISQENLHAAGAVSRIDFPERAYALMSTVPPPASTIIHPSCS
jgi:hypothetical protein